MSPPPSLVQWLTRLPVPIIPAQPKILQNPWKTSLLWICTSGGIQAYSPLSPQHQVYLAQHSRSVLTSLYLSKSIFGTRAMWGSWYFWQTQSWRHTAGRFHKKVREKFCVQETTQPVESVWITAPIPLHSTTELYHCRAALLYYIQYVACVS